MKNLTTWGIQQHLKGLSTPFWTRDYARLSSSEASAVIQDLTAAVWS